MSRYAPGILLALFALALNSACSGPGDDDGLEGHEAPGFTLAGPDGRSMSLPERRDGVDIYYFWATWCAFCNELKPELQALVEEFGDDVRVIAINFREDERGREPPAAYLERRGYHAFHLLLDGESIHESYGAWVLPGVFVVDGDGLVRFNLYQNRMPNPEGWERLSTEERARIRGPWWGERIREAVVAALP